MSTRGFARSVGVPAYGDPATPFAAPQPGGGWGNGGHHAHPPPNPPTPPVTTQSRRTVAPAATTPTPPSNPAVGPYIGEQLPCAPPPPFPPVTDEPLAKKIDEASETSTPGAPAAPMNPAPSMMTVERPAAPWIVQPYAATGLVVILTPRPGGSGT